MKLTDRVKGFLFIIVATCAFGTIPIMSKVAILHGAASADINFTRFAIVTAFYVVYMRAKRISWKVGRRNVLTLLALGFLCYGNVALFFYLAMQTISPAVGEILLYTYPAMVAVGSHFFLRERLTGAKLVSLAAALAGCLLVLYAPMTAVNTKGVIFAILTAVCYSAYIIGNKKALKQVDPVVSAAYMAACCMVYFLVFGLTTHTLSFSYDPVSFIAMLVLAFWCTIIGILSFMRGLILLEATTASIVSTFEPVFTLVISALFLHDPITWVQVAGGGIILGGVLLLELARRKKSDGGGISGN